MNRKLLIAYAKIKQIEFEVEGMKAANFERGNNGFALAYNEVAFVQASKDIDKILNDLNKGRHKRGLKNKEIQHE